ncbi:hypothetical protein BJX76DRAFT_334264 [Aspergillus varians]
MQGSFHRFSGDGDGATIIIQPGVYMSSSIQYPRRRPAQPRPFLLYSLGGLVYASIFILTFITPTARSSPLLSALHMPRG